jgi:hypothetical protein
MTLRTVFGGLTDHTTHDGRPVLVPAGPETTVDSLYRARVFQSSVALREALIRPDLQVGPPPSLVASSGRMNAWGISVFYGATKPTVAMSEVRPPVGSRVITARFRIIRKLRLLDLEAMKALNVKGSIFDPTYAERLAKASFLNGLSVRISKPVLPDDERIEYITTQAIVDFLASELDPPIDGLIYASAQNPNGTNVVLFHKSSRVKPMEIPEGTRFGTSPDPSDDDYSEPEYFVFEQVHPTAPVKSSEDEFFSASGAEERWNGDDREFSLQLDETAVEVHHITEITYKSEPYRLVRHRIYQEDKSAHPDPPINLDDVQL